MTRKLIKGVVFIVILAVGVWYFIVKDYNYKITFTTPQVPGIVYDHLIKWNNGQNPENKVITTFKQTPFSHVSQQLIVNDSIFKINWYLEKKNDSTTLVTVKIKDTLNSFNQKLQVIFTKNAFVKRSVSTVKRFAESLIQNGKNYKVSKVTNAIIPSSNCAYIELESNSEDKASTMFKNISIITDYIKNNDIKLTGDPFLEITDWNIEKDEIKFNFCFPIEEQDFYPETNTIKFKKAEEKNALKVVFNGNYKISDRAWYSIMDYAEYNNIEIENLPVEVFLNDPHAGGNSLEWEAEIYMPLKN